ncbi:AEC family transporter [Virgibacillus sp. W0181]|uniref:AEC family transporter n=1 Tax=Virgibacillus sp. W0181 TaxID=3391581 RepID=UPI003F4733A4
MLELIFILKDIILPIFVLMVIGFIIQRRFHLNVQTLARLNIYIFVPGFIFVKLYEAQFSASLFGKVFLFFILYVLLLFIVSHISARLLHIKDGKKATFTNSVLFFNSGNYGVPVNDLVFKSDPFAMSIQVIVLMLQNIFLYTYGIFSLQSVSVGKLKALLGYFKMPVLYAMAAGVMLNAWSISLPSFVWVPANYIAEGMISLALLTLGAQVAMLRLTAQLSEVYFSLIIRLIIGPLLTLGIIYAFGLDGVFAQALLIASAMPTSINSAVIAQEYENHPDFAAQIVLFSTLMSTITVTLVIYVGRLLF